jgi:hypothetical protein
VFIRSQLVANDANISVGPELMMFVDFHHESKLMPFELARHAPRPHLSLADKAEFWLGAVCPLMTQSRHY